MRGVVVFCAVVLFSVVSTAAQTGKSKTTARPTGATSAANTADPDFVTVSGCLVKEADGAFTLTKARREGGATGAATSSATWTVDVAPLAAQVLDLKDRVGQRLEAVGRMVAAAPDGKDGKAANPKLQVQSLKPTMAGPPCS
jgi:hypothetical protein